RDWSPDVCSSDLLPGGRAVRRAADRRRAVDADRPAAPQRAGSRLRGDHRRRLLGGHAGRRPRRGRDRPVRQRPAGRHRRPGRRRLLCGGVGPGAPAVLRYFLRRWGYSMRIGAALRPYRERESEVAPMRRNKHNGKGRVRALLVLCAVVFALFLVRLAWMQFAMAGYYAEKVAEASTTRYSY